MKIAAHFLPLTMVIQKIGTWYILHIKQETCYLGTRNILHQQFLDQPIHYTVMRFSDLKETSTDTTADSIFEKFR